MNEAERQRVKEWFDKKWKHGECPVCHTNLWTPMLDTFAQLENLDRAGGRIPVLVILCDNCGYFLTINALKAGIRQLPGTEVD